jgi:hypothetical protein
VETTSRFSLTDEFDQYKKRNKKWKIKGKNKIKERKKRKKSNPIATRGNRSTRCVRSFTRAKRSARVRRRHKVRIYTTGTLIDPTHIFQTVHAQIFPSKSTDVC